MTELFEDNQRDLERAVENLGYLLEQNPDVQEITKLKHDITNQSVSPRLNVSCASLTAVSGIRTETPRHSS